MIKQHMTPIISDKAIEEFVKLPEFSNSHDDPHGLETKLQIYFLEVL